jgi:quinol monooxygenase YgiN
MTEVHLTGSLHCRDDTEADTVRRHLPDHVRRTRAEHGCLSFEVEQTADPLIWAVEERFADRASFTAHQERTTTSPWGVATVGIERRYDVTGL